MYKNYQRYMSDSPECMDAFFDACGQMTGSSFIVAESRIRSILKTIASSLRLFNLFVNAAKGFCFEDYFDSSRIPIAEGRYVLKLPKTKEAFVCFVLRLLQMFDSKEMDFHVFLSNYFYNKNDLQESYYLFCTTIIDEFCKVVINLYYGDETAADNFAVTAGGVDQKEKFLLSNRDAEILRREVGLLIADFKALKLKKPAEDEIIDILTVLEKAIIARDKDSMKAIWIGCKNTLVRHVVFTRAHRLESALIQAWVI